VDELGLTDTLQLEDLASELSKVRGTVIVWLGSCGSGATVDAATGRMPADANGDGKLTQHELFLYIKAREEDPAYFIYQNVQEYPLNSDYVLFVS